MGYNYREMNVIIKEENFARAEELLREAEVEVKDQTLQGVPYLIQATSSQLCTTHVDAHGDLVFEASGGDAKYSYDYWQEPLESVIENNSYIEVSETFGDSIYRTVFYGGKCYRGIMPVWPTGEQLASMNNKAEVRQLKIGLLFSVKRWEMMCIVLRRIWEIQRLNIFGNQNSK